MRKVRKSLFAITLAGVMLCATACGDNPQIPVPETITYTVTYDLNGGTGTLPTETKKAKDEKFDLAGSTGFSFDGHTFEGWHDGTNKYDAGAEYTMPAANVTLTAQWSEVEHTYSVTFMDGETVVQAYTDKKTGDKVAVPDAPDKGDDRYTFTGWEGLDPSATEVTVYNQDVIYRATWNERFGSSTVFSAMERNMNKPITVDGDGSDDAWTDATAYDLDENGSTVKLLWDENGIYIFADVKKVVEPAAQADGDDDEAPDAPAIDDDLGVIIDLLHSDALASDGWDGKGWGGSYRGEPGPMVEGGYTIKAGAKTDADVSKSWEWLSAGDQDRAVGSVVAEDGSGYTVEFKIGTTNASIGEYKPHVGQEIGLGIKTHDNASALESFAGYSDHGPKSLSNVLLVRNEANLDFLWSVKEVRENYDIVVDGKEDRLLYERDAGVINVGEDGTTVKALWHKSGKMYVLVNFGTETTSMKVEAFGGTVEFTKSGEQTLYEGVLTCEEAFTADKWSEFTLTVNDEPTESYIRLVRNENNFGRSMYTAKKLADGATIAIDGDLDEAYGAKVADVNTISLREHDGTPASTGEAYIRWDDEYLYVFVDVTDSDVSTEQRGDAHANDSVEVWLDTCQMLPTASTGWGEANRPLGLYRGEGGYRVLAGKIGADSGQHWLWDDSNTKPETASKLKYADDTTTVIGYTVEYKIPWGKKLGDPSSDWTDGFANYIPSTGAHVDNPEENYTKLGEIVDIMININDDNGQDGVREGITSLNERGCNAWDRPYVLSQLKLVAADDGE